MAKHDKIKGLEIQGSWIDEGLLPDNPAIKFPDAPNTHCCICGEKIIVQIYMNSGVCCELHRKDRDNDHGPARISFNSGRS